MLIGNDKRQTSLSRVNWKALGLHEILLMQGGGGGGGSDHYETLAVFWIVSSSWALTARRPLFAAVCNGSILHQPLVIEIIFPHSYYYVYRKGNV